MGNILGLTEEEQLEVYRAVVDLVKSRIERAKSVKKKGKVKEGVDVEHVSRNIMDKLGKGLYRKFYDEKVLSQVEGTARSMGVTVGQGAVTAEEKEKYEEIEKAKEEELAAKEAAHAAVEAGAAPAEAGKAAEAKPGEEGAPEAGKPEAPAGDKPKEDKGKK